MMCRIAASMLLSVAIIDLPSTCTVPIIGRKLCIALWTAVGMFVEIEISSLNHEIQTMVLILLFNRFFNTVDRSLHLRVRALFQ